MHVESRLLAASCIRRQSVEMWRGGSRFGLSVAAPFVWRCPSNLAVAPFPHPAHRTGQADLPHPLLPVVRYKNRRSRSSLNGQPRAFADWRLARKSLPFIR